MAKVLQADVSVADAYVTKTFGGGPYTDVWVTLQVAWDADAQTAWTGSFGGDFFDLLNSLASQFESVFVADDGGTLKWFEIDSIVGQPPLPIAETYFVVEFHWQTSVAVELIVDGTSIGTDVADANNVGGIKVGQQAGNLGGLVFINYVKVGSTQGDDDIFGDDFEDGTLAAWDIETGSVSVVDDPFGSVPVPDNPNLFAGGVADRGGNEPLISTP